MDQKKPPTGSPAGKFDKKWGKQMFHTSRRDYPNNTVGNSHKGSNLAFNVRRAASVLPTKAGTQSYDKAYKSAKTAPPIAPATKPVVKPLAPLKK